MEHAVLMSDSHTVYDIHEMLVSDGHTESYDDVQSWNKKRWSLMVTQNHMMIDVQSWNMKCWCLIVTQKSYDDVQPWNMQC